MTTATVNVQFSDATETVIVAVFGCPQDSTVYPNQGTTPVSDARYKAFYDELPVGSTSGLAAPMQS